MISVVTASTLIAYCLYTISEETVAKFGTRRLIYTVPFVLYGIFRYLYLIHQKNEGGSPEHLILKDKPLLTDIFCWIIAAAADPGFEVNAMSRSKVAVLKTSPGDGSRRLREVMRLAGYREVLSPDRDLILKLNLSWTKYFPACSSQPWQVEGVVRTLLEDGFPRDRLFPGREQDGRHQSVEGAQNNLWMPVLKQYGLAFTPLPEVEWMVYQFKSRCSSSNQIFPEGIQIPKMYIGKQIIHLPTVKTHGHSTTTGAIKNAFGGLLKEVRHYAHKYMHEVLVDLMIMQKELHPRIFAVMDGTVCGDGAGPRTMIPHDQEHHPGVGGDSVAIDAIAAKMMGFDPMAIPYLRMGHETRPGCRRPPRDRGRRRRRLRR